MKISRIGIGVICGGVILLALGGVFIGTLIGIAFAAIIAGVVLLIVGRFGGRFGAAPVPFLKRLSFNRHDIIKSTNWVRLGWAEFRAPIGTSLIIFGVLLLILELIWRGRYPLLPVWLIIIASGAILLILSLRPYSIEHDYTKRILIKIPDLLSIHTFHTCVRQSIEDIGYIITENVSPGEGSSVSSFNNNIFLLNGGIKAIKKKILGSKLIVPELAGIPVIKDILTLFGVGILLSFLGLSLIVHCMTVWTVKDWSFSVLIIGFVLVLLGALTLIYDYISRVKRLALIHVREEGSAYIPTINIYDPRILGIEKSDLKIEARVDPNISVFHTSCELMVTLSATRNRFFEVKELENDFKTIVVSVENVIIENIQKSREVLTALFGEESNDES